MSLVVLVLLASIAINFLPFVPRTSSFAELIYLAYWTPQRPLEQLPALVLSTAALMAILAYIREYDKTVNEKARSKSEFFFRQATQGLDEVFDLLKDTNNDSVIWVRAARSLLQALQLSKEIELREYQNAYRLHENRIRNDLYLVLTYVDDSGDRQSLPPQFFYGYRKWRIPKSLDEVAVETSDKSTGGILDINETPQGPSTRPIPPRSIIPIFEFLEYPDDYEEPLDTIQSWESPWHEIFGVRSGAARYVHHRGEAFPIGGKLYKFDDNDDLVEVKK